MLIRSLQGKQGLLRCAINAPRHAKPDSRPDIRRPQDDWRLVANLNLEDEISLNKTTPMLVHQLIITMMQFQRITLTKIDHVISSHVIAIAHLICQPKVGVGIREYRYLDLFISRGTPDFFPLHIENKHKETKSPGMQL